MAVKTVLFTTVTNVLHLLIPTSYAPGPQQWIALMLLTQWLR